MSERPPRDEHKIVVRVPTEVFDALDRLARMPKRSLRLVYGTGVSIGAARYAEVARVLLASELLPSTAPQSTRVAVAVLSNATFILAAAFARLTYTLQEDLANVAAVASRVERDVLADVQAGSDRGPYVRKEGQSRAPILNLTLGGWMHRALLRCAEKVPDADVKEAGLRSKLAYTVIRLLEIGVERRETESLIQSYAKAVVQVRVALEEAVASQRGTVREYLQAVRPPQ